MVTNTVTLSIHCAYCHGNLRVADLGLPHGLLLRAEQSTSGLFTDRGSLRQVVAYQGARGGPDRG